jgi:hypothetical protein
MILLQRRDQKRQNLLHSKQIKLSIFTMLFIALIFKKKREREKKDYFGQGRGLRS